MCSRRDALGSGAMWLARRFRVVRTRAGAQGWRWRGVARGRVWGPTRRASRSDTTRRLRTDGVMVQYSPEGQWFGSRKKERCPLGSFASRVKFGGSNFSRDRLAVCWVTTRVVETRLGSLIDFFRSFQRARKGFPKTPKGNFGGFERESGGGFSIDREKRRSNVQLLVDESDPRIRFSCDHFFVSATAKASHTTRVHSDASGGSQKKNNVLFFASSRVVSTSPRRLAPPARVRARRSSRASRCRSPARARPPTGRATARRARRTTPWSRSRRT